MTKKRRPQDTPRIAPEKPGASFEGPRKAVLAVAGAGLALAVVSVVIGGSMRSAGSPTLDPASGHIHPAEVTRSGVVSYLNDRDARTLNLCKVGAVGGLAVSAASLIGYRVRFKRWPFG